MIRKILILMAVVFPAGVLCSCISDLDDPTASGGATINIGTRAPGDLDDPSNPDWLDYKIERIRVMAFRGGEARSNKVYNASLGQTITHTIPVGTYDFVFIANEPASLTATLDGILLRAQLSSLSISAADIDRAKVIPQVQIVEGVKVSDNGTVQHPDINGNTPTSDWHLALVRLAARIDLTLYSTKVDLTGAFTGVKLTGLPDRVSLVAPADYTGTTVTRTRTASITATEYFTTPEAADIPAGSLWSTRLTRVIVPANEFTPATDATKAIGMTVLLHNQYNPSAAMGIGDQIASPDHTLPRNHWLEGTGEVITPLMLNISVSDWSLKTPSANPTTQRGLNVSEIETPRDLNNYQGEWRVSFWSNQPDVELEPDGIWGTDVAGYTAGTTFKVADYWDVTDFTHDPSTGRGSVTFKLKDLPSAPIGLVTQKIVLRAGNDAVAHSDATIGDLRRELTLRARYLVYAPPGVVGISKSGKLTLKGSSTYSGVPEVKAIADDDFGGLESEPVYVTYQKWGSTIAIIGGGDQFEGNCIVWAPDGYKNTPATGNPFKVSQAALDKIRSEFATGSTTMEKWDKVPYGDLDGRTGNAVPVWPATNAATGLGDLCAYADAGTPTIWHTPSGGPWRNPWRNGEAQYPFTQNGASNPYWRTDIPIGIASGASALSSDGSIFIPAAGQIRPDWGSNSTYRAGESGNSISTSAVAAGHQNLYFTNTLIYTGSATVPYHEGLLVRCVKSNGLVHAAPGMIGIRDQAPAADRNTPNAVHELTLAGSNIYANRPEPFVTASPFGAIATEPVYAVYYKWGSNVGMLGEVPGINGETGAYDSHDVVSNPNGVVTNAGYNSFTPANPDTNSVIGYGDNSLNNQAIGHRDPCETVGSGGHRTPMGRPWRLSNETGPVAQPFGTFGVLDSDPIPWTTARGSYAAKANFIDAATIEHGRSEVASSGGALSDDKTLYMPGAGQRNNSGTFVAGDAGVRGYYWTSTMYVGGGHGFYLFFGPNNVNPSGGQNMNNSYTVRCVRN